MKASVYTKYGPPEVVKIIEIPKPQPKDDEVLIKVHVTTVNRTDCGFRSAEYFISRFFSGLWKPKLKVLGNEFAGEVEAIGKNVTTFTIGDKVFGYNDTTLVRMPNIWFCRKMLPSQPCHKIQLTRMQQQFVKVHIML